LGRAVLRRLRDLVPITGLFFNRPVVLFQSDDWGRVGLRDVEGFKSLQAAGLDLGQRPYDFYTLETADDLSELKATLERHRDSMNRHPCLEMNFILGNLDFGKMEADSWQKIHILQLASALPFGWARPGLLEAYRSGIANRVFQPALHGMTHFCRTQVERTLLEGGERSKLLRTLWQAGTPYIHWRMPWVGYEYWSPENSPAERFLSKRLQEQLIGEAVGAFAKMFSLLPSSACAPGYRTNEDTLEVWGQHGIKVVQNGPGALIPPYIDRNEMLHLARNVEFEPAVHENFSLQACLHTAESCFSQGVPVIVSIHSINFHSTVRDFRSRTLQPLDDFLSTLEEKYKDLMYLHSTDLYELAQTGICKTPNGNVHVKVLKRKFRKTEPLVDTVA
jgi:hypothetical protein